MVLATWITVVTLELIHASIPDFLEGVYLLDGNQCGATRILVIHNNFRIDFGRCIIQVSALSALDGRPIPYHPKLIGQKLE